jgi:excinuclease ABC subunit C
MAMAQENAHEEAARASRGSGAAHALEALSRDLGLEAPPRRIEGFDIAHLEGEDTVASLVCFADGRPDRNQDRAFTIRTFDGKVNDFTAIREAVAWRQHR